MNTRIYHHLISHTFVTLGVDLQPHRPEKKVWLSMTKVRRFHLRVRSTDNYHSP